METGGDPPFEIQSGAFNVLVAPEHVALGLLRGWLGRSRFLLLYVCGNYSRLLSRINIRNVEFDVRRAFTASQLLSIAGEAHHTFVFLEHDPTLYSESEEMAGYVSMALRELSRESTVVLYSPEFDGCLRSISKMADRVFCLEVAPARRTGPRPGRAMRGRARSYAVADGQSRLEGF